MLSLVHKIFKKRVYIETTDCILLTTMADIWIISLDSPVFLFEGGFLTFSLSFWFWCHQLIKFTPMASLLKVENNNNFVTSVLHNCTHGIIHQFNYCVYFLIISITYRPFMTLPYSICFYYICPRVIISYLSAHIVCYHNFILRAKYTISHTY